MRRLTTVLLATCLLGASASPVVAEEPPPSPSGDGQRVDVPEEAYAVTFPDSWEVGVFPMEMGESSPDGTSTEAEFMSAYGWAPDGSTQCLVTNEPLNDPPGDAMMALEEHADWALSHYEPVLVETSSLDLPAGPAIRYVFESEGSVGAAYFLSDGFDLFFLTCLGMDPSKRPADDWLSIAETFEFLPAEE
jgi:hypothetical protein